MSEKPPFTDATRFPDLATPDLAAGVVPEEIPITSPVTLPSETVAPDDPTSASAASELDASGSEVSRTVVDYGTLVIKGLRRSVISFRLGRAERQVDKLPTSAQVHGEVADVMLRRDGPKGTWRSPQVGLEPVTLSQRRQSIRASRRASKALRLQDTNYFRQATRAKDIRTEPRRAVDRDSSLTSARTLGSGIGKDLGTDEFEARVRAERRGMLDTRRVLKENKGYRKRNKKIEKLMGQVENSAAGRDIPGRITSRRIASAQRRVDRLSGRMDTLSETVDTPLVPTTPLTLFPRPTTAETVPPIALGPIPVEVTSGSHSRTASSPKTLPRPIGKHYSGAKSEKSPDDIGELELRYIAGEYRKDEPGIPFPRMSEESLAALYERRLRLDEVAAQRLAKRIFKQLETMGIVYAEGSGFGVNPDKLHEALEMIDL